MTLVLFWAQCLISRVKVCPLLELSLRLFFSDSYRKK